MEYMIFFKKKDKKGLEMAISTIVVMTLLLFLLVILLVLMTTSGSNFSEKVKNLLGSSNVDIIVNDCNTLHQLGSNYEYCCTNKTIRLSGSKKLEMSCFLASSETWGSRINKLNCEGIC